MGTSLRLCSERQCSSSALGLCWDLRQLRDGKCVCTGVSVCDGMAEIESSTVAVQALLQPAVQTLNLLQAGSEGRCFCTGLPMSCSFSSCNRSEYTGEDGALQLTQHSWEGKHKNLVCTVDFLLMSSPKHLPC